MKDKKKLWLISEVYAPDEVGGAYIMGRLAQGLAESFDVNVLCGYPVYTARGVKVPKREVRAGVCIERCRATRFDKNIIALRMVNLLTVMFLIFCKALLKVKRGDVVLTVTYPPFLPFFINLACRLKGAQVMLRIDDVYPETLIATGMASRQGITARFLGRMNRLLYGSVDFVAVLGRDMERLVRERCGNAACNIVIINNWAETDLIKPVAKADNPLLAELGLQKKFVVQCAGNMGRAQGIEDMFKAAELLKHEKGIHFLFIGSGAKKSWMRREIRMKGLNNVTLLDHRPRTDQPNFLNACDVALISLLEGMTGAGVPSRMYNIMAAGRPFIAIAGSGSELEYVIDEEKIGWFVPAGRSDRLVEAVLEAYSNPEGLIRMGKRARKAAEEKYSEEHIIKEYEKLIKSIL